MSKTPPIPPAQRNRRGPKVDQAVRGGHGEALGGEHGSLVNLKEQDRFATLSQNVKATHWKVQDR